MILNHSLCYGSPSQAEIRAFWLLFQLTGGFGRQAFRDYYGLPRKAKIIGGREIVWGLVVWLNHVGPWFNKVFECV